MKLSGAPGAPGHPYGPPEVMKNSQPLTLHIFLSFTVPQCLGHIWTVPPTPKPRYLKILSKHMKKRWIFVLWDVHSSHRKDTVKEYARDHKIQLSYIPAGQTGYWQPLDRSIFGLLKKKTQAELERLALTKDLAEIDMIDTLVTLTNVWNSLDPETIARSWKHIVAE